MSYIEQNKDDLLRIFSEIYSGREMELEIGSISEDDLIRGVCEDSIVIHKNHQGVVDFPIKNQNNICDLDILISEFESLILCENHVKDGILKRYGTKYVPSDLSKIGTRDIQRYGRFLITK